MQPPLEANGAHLISDEEVQRFRLDKVTPHNAPITLAGYDPAVRALEGLGRRREPVKPERCCRTAAAGAAESFVGARRIWPAWRAVRARALVSERLLPCGFEVREDGKVRGVTAAVMLDEARLRAGDLRAGLSRRGVHPGVLGFCRAELLQQNYVHAVLEAAKSMAGKLRARAGVTGDGSSLDDKTCALASGPADRVQQLGYLFSRCRNPAAHPPKVRWAFPHTRARHAHPCIDAPPPDRRRRRAVTEADAGLSRAPTDRVAPPGRRVAAMHWPAANH